MITAEHVYQEMVEMPIREREKLFTVVARLGFEKDSYRHEEVFDAIRQTPFTLKEAAEYLEVAEITVRRWANSGKVPSQKIGRNLLFDPDLLKQVKKTLRASTS
jgi:excisionase family DNA binding protein